jgi:hypothetical protein
MWGLGKGLGAIEYIINKQVWGGYSLMKNKTFRANSKEGTWKKDVEAWVGGKGSGGGGSTKGVLVR